jgi:hypothetical protein
MLHLLWKKRGERNQRTGMMTVEKKRWTEGEGEPVHWANNE